MDYPEFLREHWPIGNPYGPVAAMLENRMSGVDPINQNHSFAYGRMLELGSLQIQQITFEIPEDYAYHVDHVRISVPLNPVAEDPELLFRLVLGSQNRRYTDPLVPIRLLSSPVAYQEKEICMYLNQLVLPGGFIGIDVQATSAAGPHSCFIMIEGIRIPKDVEAYQ